MKRILTFGLLCLALLASQVTLLAQSASVTEIMVQANQLYENGQYQEAAELYQALVDGGLVDSALYYNLGNAYFKEGDWGQAALNYRRAQGLSPRDPDIRANLVLVRAQTVDQIDAEGEALFSRITRFAQRWLTLDEMAIATLVLWFAVFVLIILFLRIKHETTRQILSYAIIVVAILLFGGLFSLGGRLYIENVRPEAVIIVEEVDVTSGPGSQYVVEFSLHTGTEVSIIERRNNWIRLGLPGGRLQGWVPSDAVEPIDG